MLVFALGTLPALLSLSAISSFARGAFQRHFLRVAGVAVVLLGALNIQYGLVLTGSGSIAGTGPMAEAAAPGREIARLEGDMQVAVMRVVDFGYLPSEIVVKQGVPVEWRIDASEAAACGRILLAPRLGIRTILSGKATTTVRFTPEAPGEYAFNCGMGMMTPGAKFIVLPKSRDKS
jgi:plastocyanin